MINYIPLNCSLNRAEYSQKIEMILNGVFKYTKEVNAHVLYNFMSPTNSLGEYDFILFIDIPNYTGNYYRNKQKVYLKSLAIAVRRFEEIEVIDVDDEYLHTEDGSWNYRSKVEADKILLKDYIYKNISSVKYFDLAMVYAIKAPNCKKNIVNDILCFNKGINLNATIDIAIEKTKARSGKYANCISYKDQSSSDWSQFINQFIEIAEEHTHQGILTKKKIDELTKKNTSKLIDRAYDLAGRKLCVIRGKAGTGKTLALMKVMYNQVRQGNDAPNHNCRFLTFNNMLVADIKQVMKQIGDFTPTKVSISTLHKFFYTLYSVSPVRELHMDKEKVDRIFSLCMVRVSKVNSLIKSFASKNKMTTFPDIDAVICQYQDKIKYSEIEETKSYVDFLVNNIIDPKIDYLTQYAQDYVEWKRNTFIENYHRQAFLNGYNEILKELYLIFHNLDEFIEIYGMKTAYTFDELRNSIEFKEKYQDLYNKFILEAETRFEDENLISDDLLPEIEKRLKSLDIEIEAIQEQKTGEEQKKSFETYLKKIRRKVNWSKLIIVDEAQDCLINEKALLLELYGSDNTVIATGGRDQLIRVPEENDWSQLFGVRLDSEIITLKNVSHRQKGNIVNFLNAFAIEFEINTQLNISDETLNMGRVIVDCRQVIQKNTVPIDKVKALHLGGKDFGCSNFENIIFLLPRDGYIDRTITNQIDVLIDRHSTIRINKNSGKRQMNLRLPSYLKAIDGTINDKRNFLSNVGQDNTRCILYDSCRGLEAWNVMCIDMDTFYYEKSDSKDAEEYAVVNGGRLFAESTEMYKYRFASLWCYMALTRAIDTLYIKLSSVNNLFSRKLITVARGLSYVELLEGEYIPSLEESSECE